MHQSSGRSLRTPTVAVNIVRVITVNQPFSGPPHFQKEIDQTNVSANLLNKILELFVKYS
jgi:hypothetical protein